MKTRAGFTIIELLVVVTILGILAAIAIANFANMQDRARTASLTSNMHTTQLAVEDYKVSSNGIYPLAAAEFHPYLPAIPGGGINGFTNPFTGAAEAPLDGDGTAIQLGQISYAPVTLSGSIVNYTIFGKGKDNQVLQLTLESMSY